jgi:magnesium chelatase accessory protein
MALDGLAAPMVAFNGAFLPFKGVAGALFPRMAKLLALNPLAPRAMAFGARGMTGGLLDAMGPGLDAEGRALYRRLFESPGHVAGALAMMAAWDLAPLARELPHLTAPLELIVGEADRAVPPADARTVARRVPGARLRLLPGLGHLAHEERPDLAAAIIAEAYARAEDAAA